MIHAPSDGTPVLVPGWLVRLAAIGWRVLVTVAVVALIGYAIIFLSIVTGAILVGFVVTATAYPLVRRLRDRGWPRARAAGAVSVLALLLVVAAILLIVFALVPFVVELLRLIREGVTELTTTSREPWAPTVAARGGRPCGRRLPDLAAHGRPGAGRAHRRIRHGPDPWRVPDLLPPRGWRSRLGERHEEHRRLARPRADRPRRRRAGAGRRLPARHDRDGDDRRPDELAVPRRSSACRWPGRSASSCSSAGSFPTSAASSRRPSSPWSRSRPSARPRRSCCSCSWSSSTISRAGSSRRGRTAPAPGSLRRSPWSRSRSARHSSARSDSSRPCP